MGNKRTKARARAKTAETPVNSSRLRQIFANSSHRGTKIFEGQVLGPEVNAKTPGELGDRTDEANVEATRGKRSN